MDVGECLKLEEDPSNLCYPICGLNLQPLWLITLNKFNDHKDKCVIDYSLLLAFIFEEFPNQLRIHYVCPYIHILNSPSL